MKRRISGCMAWPAAALALGLLAAATAHAQCNGTPIASGDNAEAASAPILIDVLANDTEPDGEALTVTVLASTCPASTEIVLDRCQLHVDLPHRRRDPPQHLRHRRSQIDRRALWRQLRDWQRQSMG